MSQVLRHDPDARRVLVGLMLIVVSVVSVAGPIKRALIWEEGALTVETCESYRPLTLQKQPANVSDIGGTIQLADNTRHLFHGAGLNVHRCPARGAVLEVLYDPRDPQQARLPDHPGVFFASLAMIVFGVGIIFWPGRRQGPGR